MDTISRVRFYTNILNIWSQINPYRLLRFRINTRIMDNFLLPHISARVNSNPTSKAEKNQFLQLTVQSLQDEVPGGRVDRTAFLANALGHTKFFLFAGYDTTAGAICWTIRFLSLNPAALARLRAELDSVLGPDAAAATTLRANPHLVNSLTYTAAVLKESLRLQTNVGTIRDGGPGFSLYGPPDSDFPGQRFPTDRCVLWDGNWAIHKNPDFWHRVDEFLPERWLVTEDRDPLYPPRNAFRAFELGPRDCLGQFLAQVEMKLVLALVAREFDLAEDWEAWDVKR